MATATKTKPQPIRSREEFEARERDRKRIAIERVDDHVLAVLRGEPTDRSLLAEAGVSEEDFAAMVGRMAGRPVAAERIQGLDELRSALAEIQGERDAMVAKHLQELAPLDQQLALLNAQIHSAEIAQEKLRTTCPRFLSSALAACSARIRRLELAANKEPKPQPNYIGERGQYVHGESRDDREEEAAEFRGLASSAIHRLQERHAALVALAKTATPTRADLADIDKQFPEPERIDPPSYAPSLGNSAL